MNRFLDNSGQTGESGVWDAKNCPPKPLTVSFPVSKKTRATPSLDK